MQWGGVDGGIQDERCIRDNVLRQQGQGTFHTFMYDECRMDASNVIREYGGFGCTSVDKGRTGGWMGG